MIFSAMLATGSNVSLRMIAGAVHTIRTGKKKPAHLAVAG
jgi:hypothetical protein